jgi:flagellar hook protein FlgE
MFDAINIATSGLVGFTQELTTISNNVANLNTTGFKGSTTNFSDFFAQGGNTAVSGESGGEAGSGLRTLASVIDFSQGQINTTTTPLDTAISGNGFFVVKTTSGQIMYTRDGEFSFNSKNILVDSNGDHVQALKNGALQDITLTGLTTNPASATKTITLSGTLSTADTTKSISGVTVTDAIGATHTLSVVFTNNTATTPGNWTVAIMDGTTSVATGSVTFTAGTIDPTMNSISFTYSPPGVPAMPLSLTLDPSTTEPSSGSSTLAVETIDGFGQGTVTASSFDANGNLVVTYSNGQTDKSQQLALASFASNDTLVPVSGNNFVTGNEQSVTLGTAQTGVTTIDSSSLEASNVDLSTEFSDIIITQRGYQASSEVISTANQMLDTLIHMKSG